MNKHFYKFTLILFASAFVLQSSHMFGVRRTNRPKNRTKKYSQLKRHSQKNRTENAKQKRPFRCSCFRKVLRMLKLMVSK